MNEVTRKLSENLRNSDAYLILYFKGNRITIDVNEKLEEGTNSKSVKLIIRAILKVLEIDRTIAKVLNSIKKEKEKQNEYNSRSRTHR